MAPGVLSARFFYGPAEALSNKNGGSVTSESGGPWSVLRLELNYDRGVKVGLASGD